MKRFSLAIIFVCCTLTMAAQETIKVKYQGASPTISDFVSAFVSSRHDDEDDCADESFNALKQAWEKQRKGLSLNEWETLTVDQKNGYVCYESKPDENMLRVEMCYWNEADGKHKLFAYNVAMFKDGIHDPGQFDGLSFLRYNNASKTMSWVEAPGFDVEFSRDGAFVSYALPRTGKNIIVTTWYKNGPKERLLKWNGRKFSF